MYRRQSKAVILLTALAVCAAGVGCRSIRLPAIDPSGRRLFLPPPNYTTLAGPSPATRQFGILPTPAWQTPPLPPPCLDTPAPPTAFVTTEPDCGAPLPAPTPAVVVPQGTKEPHREQLTLSPKRIIAPVGSEVVLVAGQCSGKGYYLKRQPIDWTISRESVGQFVQVPNEHSLWRHLWNIQPEKRSADLAAARTQVRPVTITRGNADPSDDVHVASGQSWVTVTSDVEGTSRVMAYSSGVDDWSMRKQTATIYWVDAQWQLPGPACVPAGETHMLISRLTRSDGVTPICGYVVRYEVVGGPPVSFAPSGASAVDVMSDEQGNAAVEVSQPPSQPGTTEIRISIIRPPQQSADPTLTLGQGFTSLTWSAPGLALDIDGPASAAMDSTVTYHINVSNPGDQTARDVVVSDVLPPGLALIDSTPPGSPLGNRFEWRLGDLSGFATQTITLNCRATRRGDVQHCANARSADNLTAEDCVTTRIFAPSLSLNMTGPQAAEVGQQVEFRVEVTNTGTEPLTNVTVTDQFDAGLAHTEGERSPIQRVIESIPAGQTVRLAVPFNVVAPGRLCHTLEAVAAGGEKAAASACVTVAQPAQPAAQNRPELRTTLSGPADVRVGDAALYSISVRNMGNTPLTNVVISYRYPASLDPKNASAGNEHVGAALIWRVANLAVGQATDLQVQCLALRADVAAVSRVEASSEQNAGHSGEFTTRIAPAAAPGGGAPGGAPPAGAPPGGGAQTEPVTGNLSVSIAALTNPARVGQTVTYVVTLKNDRNVSDKEVDCSVAFPAEMTVGRILGLLRGEIRGNTVELSRIAELRAGEELSFRIEATPNRAGTYRVKAQVKSLRSREGVSDEEQTTVNAP